MGGCGSKNAAGDVATTTSGASTGKVDLYLAFASPPCRAVLMCAKEIKLDLNHKLVDIQKGENKTEEFLKMNPCHTVPTIKDGDLALWESTAIMMYLNDKYASDPGKLYPTDGQKRAKVNLMFGFNQQFGTNIGGFIVPQIFQKQEPDPEKEEKVKKNLDALNTVLEGKTYVAGDCLTLADFTIVTTLTVLDFKDYDYKSSYPNISAWNDRMRALPYFEECNKGWYEMLRSMSAQG